MPIHDWTRVEDGTFHHFHTTWITHLSEALNAGMLPSPYYALAEQHLGRKIADVLALHVSDPEQLRTPPEPPQGGAVAVAEAPPRVSRTLVLIPSASKGRRTLTIRHTSGHRIIGLVEILSPGNKTGSEALAEFVRKAVDALRCGIHLVVVDLLPPGPHDPQGIHAAIMEALSAEAYQLPEPGRLTFAAYSAGSPPVAYLEHPAVGEDVPVLPLFLTSERYINLALAPSYAAAYRGMPSFWREVLEGRRTLG